MSVVIIEVQLKVNTTLKTLEETAMRRKKMWWWKKRSTIVKAKESLEDVRPAADILERVVSYHCL